MEESVYVCARVDYGVFFAPTASLFCSVVSIAENRAPFFLYIHNGEQLAEEALEAAVTVRLVSLLLESALFQLLQTVRADKVLRVELFEHGRDAATWRDKKFRAPPLSRAKFKPTPITIQTQYL